MIDIGDECMYLAAEVGAMQGCATTLHLDAVESDADRRVRELRESILGVAEPQPPRRIGFVWD